MSGASLIVRNVAASFVTQIVSWILTFAVMMYLPRYLGVEGLGQLAFATSVVALVGAVVPLGMSPVLVKEIARDRSRTAELLTAAMMVRVPLAFTMALVAVLVGRLLHCPGLTRTFILFMSFGMIIGTLNDLFAAALQGQENLPRQSVAIILEKLLSSSLTIALVLYKAPFWTLAAIGIFTGAFSLMVNLTAFTSLRSSIRPPSMATIRYIVVAGIPFAGWIIFQRLYGASDPLVLGIVCDNKAVGWYSAATRLMGTTAVLPVALCSALLPTLSRLFRDQQEEFKQLARRMMALIILCATPVAAIFICIPERLIALMRYPHDFSGSVPVLRVGGGGIFLYNITIILATIVIAGDGQSKMFRTSIVATLIGIPACILGSIITQHVWKNGATGAMCSDVLLEIYLVCAYVRMLPAKTFGRDTVSLIGRTFVASVPLVALVCLTNRTYTAVWGIAAGLSVYMLVCWRLKCMDPQLMVIVRQLVTRRQESLT